MFRYQVAALGHLVQGLIARILVCKEGLRFYIITRVLDRLSINIRVWIVRYATHPAHIPTRRIYRKPPLGKVPFELLKLSFVVRRILERDNSEISCTAYRKAGIGYIIKFG